jgi:hypothetical protein
VRAAADGLRRAREDSGDRELGLWRARRALLIVAGFGQVSASYRSAMRAVVILAVLVRVAAADPTAPPPPLVLPQYPTVQLVAKREPIVVPTLLGVALSAGGAYASSRVHDESFLVTSAELGGGAAGGAIATALTMLVLAPSNKDTEIGWTGPIVLTVVALPTGVALGTWGAGELTDGSQHSGRALGGALLGTVTGAITGAIIAKVFKLGERHAAATMIGFTLSGSTFGYQLLGGGPPR